MGSFGPIYHFRYSDAILLWNRFVNAPFVVGQTLVGAIKPRVNAPQCWAALHKNSKEQLWPSAICTRTPSSNTRFVRTHSNSNKESHYSEENLKFEANKQSWLLRWLKNKRSFFFKLFSLVLFCEQIASPSVCYMNRKIFLIRDDKL